MQEVGGSIPPSSTNTGKRGARRVFFWFIETTWLGWAAAPIEGSVWQALLGEFLSIYMNRTLGRWRGQHWPALRSIGAWSVYLHVANAASLYSHLVAKLTPLIGRNFHSEIKLAP